MKNVLIVDVQPEYQNSFTFDLKDLRKFVNRTNKNVTFCFNGEDFGFPSLQHYKNWLEDNNFNIDKCNFIEKGYNFFRYLIDGVYGVTDKEIVEFICFMEENQIIDSREMTIDLWKEFYKIYPENDINEEILNPDGDLVYIPDLWNDLKDFNNVLLCGGGENECLKEVELILMAQNKTYKKELRFIY